MNYESETRKIIDAQLKNSGWDADSENLRQSKGVRPERGRNLAIAEWKTKTGYADYALFIGTKLVGLIEAKSSRKDIFAVLDCQCRDYAKNIRAVDEKNLLGNWRGYRVPFVFAANGRRFQQQFETKSGIWFLDMRDATNAPQALNDWLSPTEILELLDRKITGGNENLRAMPTNFLTVSDGLNLRDYQLRAVKAAETAVIRGQKNILLAMATGTGKTRTVLAMIYRFLKSERFRRILFLVDRTALGEQALDVFSEVKLENFLPLNRIYNISGIEDVNFRRETRVQIATVQSMYRRLFSGENIQPKVTAYDLIIVDEAHRGYTLDRDFSEDENFFQNQRDYQSKYRQVIEYFLAVKIALTATPALHTTEIFGAPIFKYGYREAVLDGWLADYDPPHILKTELSATGIHYTRGDTVTICDSATGEITNSELLADELDFDIDDFNRSVVNENFNRVVLAEIFNELDTGGGKTLIFAVNNTHADLITQILKEIYAAKGVSTEAVMKITGSIGDRRRVNEAISHFKNERYPSVVVTVDLLTTGIDVPEITTLIFLRRVKSRILFEQMLGRATRLCGEIRKTHFQIYDAVGVWELLKDFTVMKPVVANPSANFLTFLDDLKNSSDARQIQNVVDQITAKLQRLKPALTDEDLAHFKDLTGGKTPAAFISELRALSAVDAKNFLLRHENLFKFLEKITGGSSFVISEHADKIIEHSRATVADHLRDYLDEFADFVRNNRNEIAALNIVCTRPKDLSRADLQSLRLQLEREGFTAERLNAAISKMTNAEIAADIISLIRRYAVGAALLNQSDKISGAVKRLKAAHNFSAAEIRWLDRIEKYLLNESLINRAAFDEATAFKAQGGFTRIDKVFRGNLANVINELNDYLYDDGGGAA